MNCEYGDAAYKRNETTVNGVAPRVRKRTIISR